MKDLWLKHRQWLVQQGPSFPKKMQINSRASFLKFKDRTLKYWIPMNILSNLTEDQKKKFFYSKFPGKTIKHYRAEMKDGVPEVEITTKRLPPRTKSDLFGGRPIPWLTDGFGKVRPEVREALLIKPGKCARLKCLTPFPIGHRPQKWFKQDLRFWEQMLVIDDKDIDLNELSRMSISGSWPSQWMEFQKMCDETPHECTYDDLIAGVAARAHKLKLPVLPKVKLSDLDYVQTNKASFSGVITSRCFGHNHAKADSYALPMARALYLNSGSHLAADVSLWGIGGRNRLQRTSEDKPLRSRFLLMPEAPNKILALSYAQPVYDALGVLNWNDASNEIRIGGNDFHGNYYKWDEELMRMSKDGACIELDISGHDLRTIEETMVIAFGILRACFPDNDEEIDNHFFFFMSGFIFKNVATPGRTVYRVLKGIPTGSPFTSIIVSLVNWVGWSSTINRYCGSTVARNSDVKVFGDDTQLSVWRSQRWLTPEKLGNMFTKHIGHICDPCRNWDYYGDRNTKPTFLKYYPNYGLPARHSKDTVISMSFVRKSNNSDLRYANVIKGLCYAGPFDFKSYTMLERFRERLIRRHESDMGIHSAIGPKGLDFEIQRMLNITFNACMRQYLMPRIPKLDIVKNVDLGNKPKSFIKPVRDGPSREYMFEILSHAVIPRDMRYQDILAICCIPQQGQRTVHDEIMKVRNKLPARMRTYLANTLDKLRVQLFNMFNLQ